MNIKLLITVFAATWMTHLTVLVAAADVNSEAAPASLLYEMRTYYAAPGKLDELNARFRNHTLKLFEKHGMQNIGYWMPLENPEQKIIYLLAFPSREAREKSWKEFFADPDWISVQKASEAAGKLVAKVDSLFLKPTDYSPRVAPTSDKANRVFELRTYTATPGKLADLNARFANKTLPLFAKHGIISIGYWTPTEPKQGSADTLVYIVAHKDQAGADQAWKAFRQDPTWIEAKRASETNGALTVTNGVRSVYLLPTDYSPMK